MVGLGLCTLLVGTLTLVWFAPTVEYGASGAPPSPDLVDGAAWALMRRVYFATVRFVSDNQPMFVGVLALFTFVTAVRYGVSGASPWHPSPQDRIDDDGVAAAYAAWLERFTKAASARNPDALRANDGVAELLLRKSPPAARGATVGEAQARLGEWITQLAVVGLALPEYATREQFRYETYASVRRRVPGQRYAADTVLGGQMGIATMRVGGDNVCAVMCLLICAAASFMIANMVVLTASVPCVAAYVVAIAAWWIVTVC